MLAYGVSPNQHKRWLFEHIKTNRNLIRTLEASTLIEKEDRHDLLQSLRREVKEYLDEMIQLERWRKKEGYAPDRPYKPPSLIAYENKRKEDGTFEDYMDQKAYTQVAIDQLRHNLTEKGLL